MSVTLERVLFLTVAGATHGIVGYALAARFTDVDPRVGFCLALVPDLDFLFPAAWGAPFVHRGITHTAAFAATIVVASYAISRRRSVALAAGLAVGSHLAIDALSPAGVTTVLPLGAASVPSPGVAVHGPAVTIALWLLAVALLRSRADR